MVKPDSADSDINTFLINAFKDENLHKSSKAIPLPDLEKKQVVKEEKQAIFEGVSNSNEQYKKFIKSLIVKLNESKGDYDKYYANKLRHCDKIGKVYQNNIAILELLKKNKQFIEKSETNQLELHLISWIKGYENQYKSNRDFQKDKCNVEYDGPEFPTNITNKLEGKYESLE